MIRAVIVDDESLARDKLRRLLGACEGVVVVGEAASAAEAIEEIRQVAPDLVFLDIHLPGRSGFEVVEALDRVRPPLVVFVTAYDVHALRAFEVHALDYLLKPFEIERLRTALDRARERLAGAPGRAIEPLLAMLAEMHQRQGELERRLRKNGEPDRLLVRDGQELVPLRVDEVGWVGAADNYVELHVGARTYLLRDTIAGLEARLGPCQFLRIHRGTLINMERLRAFRPTATGDLRAVLTDGTQLPVGRSYRERVTRRWKTGTASLS
jgi:two-component system, LytTR family, response regulator